MTDTKVRVLMIEDNPADVRLVERYLSRAKRVTFEFLSEPNMAAGIERLAKESFDALLLDLTLPDNDSPLDGFRRVEELYPRLPIIVITGREDEELALNAVREGAQDYLLKQEVETDPLVRAILYGVERKHSEEALRESEERYAIAVKGANDGLWDWNLLTDEVHYSQRWHDILGLSSSEVEPLPGAWLDRVHSDDRARLQHEIQSHRQGKTLHFEDEHRILTHDGTYRWVLSRGVAVCDAAGTPYRMAGSLTDIHPRKLTEEQLLHDAMHDALTELPNWALLMDRLGVSMARSTREGGYLFAVLIVDLDRFKNVNDSLGHSMGDELLVAISQRLSSFVRPGDTVARLGGDEFAVLLNGILEPGDAIKVAERVAEELSRSFHLGTQEVFTTASIGIALSSAGYERPEEMLRDADTAMYKAKELGKAQYVIFDQEMREQIVHTMQVEMDLRRAVDRREFRVHYQPIVSLKGGEIEGFEALVRWDHPQRGLIAPDQFIGVAEETGLIIPMGWRVLRESCEQMASWHRQFPGAGELSISVNLSGRQFLHPELSDRVDSVLDQTGLNPTSLRLEITESMIMGDAAGAVSRLKQLAEMGVQVYIDDFGTGYSSLSYLHQLPTHTVKIDRSFIHGLETRTGRPQIISTIVALARSLGMHVAAEGLENEKQLAKLRELDCEFGQGFYFSEPVDKQGVAELLSGRPRW